MSDAIVIAEVLKNASIFLDLNAEYLEMIAEISKVFECNAGDMIFEQGSSSSELFVVATGEVDILVDQSVLGEVLEPDLITITTIRQGEAFGEIALVDDGVRSAAARCGQMETKLILIPREELLGLCRKHPKLGYQLMRNLAIELASTIRTRTTDFQMREWLTWTRGRSAP